MVQAVINLLFGSLILNEFGLRGYDCYKGDIGNARCDDIAIIGAGVTGSYAAWRLRHRNLKVSMYEYSNRIGGRCFTVNLPGIPDVNVELGAMRFSPSDHPLTNKISHDLGLDVIDFALGYGSSNDTLYYLRGNHMKYTELPTKAPYNLPPDNRIDLKTLNWNVFRNFTYSSQNGNIKSLDGVDLNMQSRDAYNAKYLDIETAQYLRDTESFSYLYGADVAAVIGLPVSDPSSSSSKKIFKTVKQGYQAIPESLVKQFLKASKRHNFFRNHHLKAIRRRINGNYVLTFQPTTTVDGVTSDNKRCHVIQTCAKKVLLAIPKMALEELDWNGLKQETVQNYLKNALKVVRAGKNFFGYNQPWWQNIAMATKYAISMTPLSQTYDFGVSNITSRAVLNPSYSDGDAIFWREALKSGKLVKGNGDNSIAMTDVSVYLTRKFFAEVFNMPLTSVPQPDSAVMKVWDEYPIGASWYAWKPGYRWEEVESRMMKPSAKDEVYITSNIFSSTDNSGWIEGGFEIVGKVLKYL